MRKDKQHATKLRLGGKSYTEISKTLDIPKSTLSGWFNKLVISDSAKKRIENRGRKKAIQVLLKHNKNQTVLAKKRAVNIRKSAKAELVSVSKRDLFLVGISLYWAEGYKRPVVRNGKEVTHHVVSLTNSDPLLVKYFLKFLREICGVPNERIKISLRFFKHQNVRKLTDYWSEETDVLRNNFRTMLVTASRSSLHIKPFNRLSYGVVQVVVADTKLFHRIMGYIEGLKKFV